MPEKHQIHIFLCHASQDKATVRELYEHLQSEGWIDPWFDEEKLYPGQEWELEIEKAVETTDAIIVFLSNNSVTKEGYVQRELRLVLQVADSKPEGTVFVIPVRLDGCPIPRRLTVWQYVDYFPETNKKSAYERLLKSLKVRADKLGIPSSETIGDRTSTDIEIPRKISFPAYAAFQQDLMNLVESAMDDFISIRGEISNPESDGFTSYETKFSFEYSVSNRVWDHNGTWYFMCTFCRNTNIEQAMAIFEERVREIKSALTDDWKFEERENAQSLDRKQFEATKKYNTLRIVLTLSAFDPKNRTEVKFKLERL